MIGLPPSFICVLCLVFGLAAQQGGASSVASGRYPMSGRVIHAITGDPQPGTYVIAEPVDRSDPSQTTVTDQNGRFLFKGLSPGKYRLVAKRPGFPEQAFEAHGSRFVAVAVGPDKESQSLVFRLKPEGSISGRVMSDQEEAVRDGKVMLFVSHVEGGESTIAMQRSVETADDGSYRFSHLPAGRYFVAVSARPWYAQHKAQAACASSPACGDTQSSGNSAEMDVAYPVTYYGDSVEPNGAIPISLNWGERAIADINLRAVPAVHLRLANETPNSSLGIVGVTLKQSLIGGNQTLVGGETVSSGPNRLEISGLAPGQYDIGVEIPKEGHGEANSIPRHQLVDVSANTEVDASAGSQFVTITGVVNFEGQNVPTEARLQLHSRESGRDLEMPVGAKGEIESLDVGPGHYDLLLLNAGGFVLKSVSAVHAHAVGQVVEIDSPDDVQLRLIASKGVGRVEGTVLCDNKSVAAAMVLLVPQDLVNSRGLFRGDLSATDGSFSFPGVAPGKYTLVAIQDGTELEWSNPTVLHRYMTHGESLQVDPNGKSNIALKLQ